MILVQASELGKTQEIVKLFTHTDLDGVGCEVVGKLAFGAGLNTTHVDYHNVNEIIKDFLINKEYQGYDKIYITDISVNEEVAEMINSLPELEMDKFRLLDHHDTAMWMNKYWWANVRTMQRPQTGKESGTSFFYNHLLKQGFFANEKYQDALTIFVEKVRRYDCWEWKTMYNDDEALRLNNLFWLYGRTEFAKNMVKKFNTIETFSVREGSWVEMFDDADKAVLKVDKAKSDAYFKKKNKQIISIPFNGHTAGVVFAEQYISELGNVLNDMNPEYKFIAIIDMGNKKVSLRTVHDSIHLGKDVASMFGGGGHAKASGFSFDANILKLVMMMIFSTTTKGLVKKMQNIVFGTGLIGKISKMIDLISKK